MGDVIKPNPAQWANRNEGVENDEIVRISSRLFQVLMEENSNSTNSLAALHLVQKSVMMQIAHFHGVETAKKATEQANEIADNYTFTIMEGK